MNVQEKLCVILLRKVERLDSLLNRGVRTTQHCLIRICFDFTLVRCANGFSNHFIIAIRSITKTNRGSLAHFSPRVSTKKAIEEQYGRVGKKARPEKIIVRAAPTSRLILL